MRVSVWVARSTTDTRRRGYNSLSLLPHLQDEAAQLEIFAIYILAKWLFFFCLEAYRCC